MITALASFGPADIDNMLPLSGLPIDTSNTKKASVSASGEFWLPIRLRVRNEIKGRGKIREELGFLASHLVKKHFIIIPLLHACILCECSRQAIRACTCRLV